MIALHVANIPPWRARILTTAQRYPGAARSRKLTAWSCPLDAACLPALARLGMIVLPPDLRAQVERLDEADEALGAVVRADVERLAGLLSGR
jgi:hypothetical protein